MWNHNRLNEELEEAVSNNNIEKTVALLAEGANANYRKECNSGNKTKDTLLHHSFNAEITKELLIHGANVNSRNIYGDTALHNAAKREKPFELVRELLRNGASVNAKNKEGNTPLYYAVNRRNISLITIREFLIYGADINLYSNVMNAVTNMEYAKLIIKFNLIKNFSSDYKKIINLEPYEKSSNYNYLSSFLHDCVCEILQMKTYKFNETLTLYDLVTNNFTRYTLYNNKISLEVDNINLSEEYIIYLDIISDYLQPFLKRAKYLKELKDLQIFTYSVISPNIKRVILDPGSVYCITGYLCNHNLLNLIDAFCNFEQKGTTEKNIFTGIHEAKRARLE